MEIAEAKARLARLGGAPSGTIPNSAQESVIKSALDLLPEFCKEVFQKTGCLSNGRGISKDNSHYWVVPDMCRIDCNTGLFFLNQKSRRALNLLTVWMAHTGIPLDDDGVCRDKVMIERAISTLRRWCEETRKKKEEAGGYYPGSSDFKELVWGTVFTGETAGFTGKSSYRRSAREFWKAVQNAVGKEDCEQFEELSSAIQFRKMLSHWAKIKDTKFFTVTEHTRSKNTTFTLSLP
jgi:hypothetical protein